MRRLILVLSAIFTSVGLAVSLAVSDIPQAVSEEPAASAQYHGGDHAEPPQEGSVPNFGVQEPDVQVPDLTVSQTSEGSVPEAHAPPQAIAQMEPAKAYSQVVDNAWKRRFSARGWEESSRKSQRNARDYSYIQPARDAAPARYRVKIPTTGEYTVYARWPAASINNSAARFGVSTPTGIRWTEVNQRRDGGMWMRIGAYRMEAGDRYVVRVSGRSKEEGRIVADAVMVTRGTQVTPPGGDTVTGKTLGGQVTGHDVVREARSHIGTPYRHSPPEPCLAHRSEDCSCLTSLVFASLDLPDDPIQQWNFGREVPRSELRPGDLVFFKEGGSSVITHVGIYSGNGNMIHASSYWGSVVEREMKYVDGYFGARRLTD